MSTLARSLETGSTRQKGEILRSLRESLHRIWAEGDARAGTILASLGDPAGVAARNLEEADEDTNEYDVDDAVRDLLLSEHPEWAFARARPLVERPVIGASILARVRVAEKVAKDSRWRELAAALSTSKDSELAFEARELHARLKKPGKASPPSKGGEAKRELGADWETLGESASFAITRLVAAWSEGDLEALSALQRAKHPAALAAAWLDSKEALAAIAKDEGTYAVTAERAGRAVASVSPEGVLARLAFCFTNARLRARGGVDIARALLRGVVALRTEAGFTELCDRLKKHPRLAVAVSDVAPKRRAKKSPAHRKR